MTRGFHVRLFAVIMITIGLSVAPVLGAPETKLATISYETPLSANELIRELHASASDLRVEEIYHIHKGKSMTFVGSYLPSVGAPNDELIREYSQFHDLLLDDLEPASSQMKDVLSEVKARRESVRQNGTRVYGLVVEGSEAAIKRFGSRTKAADIQIGDTVRKQSPVHPDLRTWVDKSHSDELGIAAADYCPYQGLVSTYKDVEGWCVFYNEMKWSATSLARFTADEGYEHDVVLNNYDGLHWAAGLRGTLRGTGWDSNLPLVEMKLYRVVLGHTLPRSERGEPRLADAQTGARYWRAWALYRSRSESRSRWSRTGSGSSGL